jgi:hypothetical protein
VVDHRIYLDGQPATAQNAFLTGYRWENRFHLLAREDWINPVLSVEFENINGAEKSLLEVAGHDGSDDLATPNAEARREKQREIETKSACHMRLRKFGRTVHNLLGGGRP